MTYRLKVDYESLNASTSRIDFKTIRIDWTYPGKSLKRRIAFSKISKNKLKPLCCLLIPRIGVFKLQQVKCFLRNTNNCCIWKWVVTVPDILILSLLCHELGSILLMSFVVDDFRWCNQNVIILYEKKRKDYNVN